MMPHRVHQALRATVIPLIFILQQHLTHQIKSTTNTTTNRRSKSNSNIQILFDGDKTEQTLTFESILLNSSSITSLKELCKVTNISTTDCSCNTTPAFCDKRLVEMFARNLYYQRSDALTTSYAIVTLLASTFGVVGNLAVLVATYKQLGSLSSCKLHIGELAVVNLIFSVTSIVNVMHLFASNTWFLDVAACKFIRALLEVCGFLSIGIILIIAVERFCLVVYRVEVEGRCKHIVVLLDLLFVCMAVIPYIIGLNIERDSGRCIEFAGDLQHLSLSYSWFALVTFSFVPLCVISVLYGRIVCHISKQANTIDRSSNHVLYMKKG